jgi:hypothetical protein
MLQLVPSETHNPCASCGTDDMQFGGDRPLNNRTTFGTGLSGWGHRNFEAGQFLPIMHQLHFSYIWTADRLLERCASTPNEPLGERTRNGRLEA